MFIRQPRQALSVAIALALVMVATRGHATWQPLPDASWAVFFLAGLWLKPVWVLAPLAVLATLVDWAAVRFAGVSSFCITGVYAMLLPTYLVLWGGGRWLALLTEQRASARAKSVQSPTAAQTVSPSTVLNLLAPVAPQHWLLAVVVAALLAELLASGSFYFFGGHFDTPTLRMFLQREMHYFPPMLLAMLLYSGLGMAAWRVLSNVGKLSQRSV